MRGLHAAASGFYENDSGAGFGAVLVVREETAGSVVVVRKAERAGYEFGGRCAFPGGMVRWSQRDQPFLKACQRSLEQRVAREAGLELPDVVVRLLTATPPPVSCYTARGGRRHTLVLAFEAKVASSTMVCSRDRSVAEALWVAPLEALGTMAPANTVIAARVLWQLLGSRERRAAAAAVRVAVDDCARWAAEIGLPAPLAQEFPLGVGGAVP